MTPLPRADPTLGRLRCVTCGLFPDDVVDHKRETGHREFEVIFRRPGLHAYVKEIKRV